MPTKTSPALTSPENSGFSLLELLVVLVIVAFVAAVVVVSWSGVHHEAIVESAVGRLRFLDQHMRSYARTHHTECQLSFEIGTSRIRKLYHTRNNENPAWETLGQGIRIKELQAISEQQRGRRIDILMRRDGTSTTYGIHLVGSGERELWLVFAGVSGQVTALKTEREFHAALETVSAARRL